MKWFRQRTAQVIIAAGALFAIVGCGGPGSVSGKVTYNGQPLPGGLVAFHDSKGQIQNGKVNADGTYTVSFVNPGPARVTVITAKSYSIARHPEALVQNPYGPYVWIDPKFGQADNSGLSLDVKSGKQSYDIIMTSTATQPDDQQ